VFSLLVASSLIAAQLMPADVEGGFAHDLTSLSPNGGSIVLQLFVSPSGVVEGCQTVYSDWTALATERACGVVAGKKVSKVAMNGDGTPVYGTVLFSMVARADASGALSVPFEREADLTVTVASLPASAGGKIFAAALVLVDGQGTIVDCSADPDGEPVAPAYVNVACAQLKQVRSPVRNGADGNPVPYVTDLSVEFVVEGSAQG
jgi:hypothetical protein